MTNTKIENITLGCDPEVFIWDKQLNEPYPITGLIGGSKDSPKDIGNGCGIQEDNVLAEFTIPPTNNIEEYKRDIKYCIEFINSILPKEFRTKIQASAYFHENYLKSEQAQTFGCHPDYNAWTGKQNISPKCSTTLRTSGKIVCHLN
jgi:hypothetical protein